MANRFTNPARISDQRHLWQPRCLCHVLDVAGKYRTSEADQPPSTSPDRNMERSCRSERWFNECMGKWKRRASRQRSRRRRSAHPAGGRMCCELSGIIAMLRLKAMRRMHAPVREALGQRPPAPKFTGPRRAGGQDDIAGAGPPSERPRPTRPCDTQGKVQAR